MFGLRILYDTAEYYASPIDTCKGTVSSENIDKVCNHSGSIHTERDNVQSAFSSKYPGGESFTNILWSGHLITSTGALGEINTNRSLSWKNIVLMIKRSTGINRMSDTVKALMHELNHQFGVGDHYHKMTDDGTCENKTICSVCGDNPRSKECMMFDSTCDKICTDCINDIKNHLNDHHKQ